MNQDGLMTASVALSTLCTILYIGLGFLPRPSRPAAIWSLSFIGFMLATYVAVAADVIGSLPLRAVSSGLMLGMIGVIWVGLHVQRTHRSISWLPALVFLLVAPALLWIFSSTEAYLTVVRAVFAAAGVFALLVMTELIRLGRLVRDEILPLAFICATYVVLGVVSLAQELLRLLAGTPESTQLESTRELNTIGSLLFVVAAATTLLLMTRQSATLAEDAGTGSFSGVARDRLSRAEAGGDRWWSVIVIRLDDPEVLREASSTNAFDAVAQRFAAVVRMSLPAEADIDRRGSTEIVALLPRPDGAVRQVITRVLADVASMDSDSQLAVRMSASVGWASVDEVGYDLDVLIAQAMDAATSAAADGGDRWERVVGVTPAVGP